MIREISRTKNRFFSIFTICAIGVGFFSGVRATPDDMTISADRYYDNSRLFDLRVVSTFGLTDDDAQAISNIDGVSEAYKSKYTDLALHYSDVEYLTRVYSWNNNEVNIVDITEGRAPQAEDECIVCYNKLFDGMKVGSTVSFVDITESEEFPLKYKEYKVVGLFDTPMYISLTQRGSTNIGDGKIDAFAYIAESNFTQDVYTEIYIKSDKLEKMQSYSDEYEQLRDEISTKLEELGEVRSPIRYDEVIGEALEEIADGEKELDEAKTDGQQELDDAKAELEDAAQKIADGEKELADAKSEIDDGEQQLKDAEQKLSEAKEEIDKARQELEDNRAELQSAEKELADAASEIESGEKELADAKKTLDETLSQLTDGQREIDQKRAEIETAKSQLEAGEQQLKEGKVQYEAGLLQYEQGMAEYNEGEKALIAAENQLKEAEKIYGENNPLIVQQKVELEAQKNQLMQAYAQLAQTEQILSETKQQLDEAESELVQNRAMLESGETQLSAAQQKLDDGRARYEDGLAQYNEAAQKLDEGKAEYRKGLDEYNEGLQLFLEGEQSFLGGEQEYEEAAATLEEKRKEFLDGKAEYESGIKELDEAKQKYSDGMAEYEDGLLTFESEIADAEKKIADAKKEIEDAGEAKWYIFERDDNVGYAEYKSNAERIGKIASIFPVFFLLVAALVCLTTMSRMVEEQRTQIGTLKALGYSNGVIMRHYMTYALTAAISGGLIGAICGCFIFPKIIIFAYSMMYSITKIYYQLSFANIGLSVGSMVLTIAATVYFSCKKVLGETSAQLMRPKAPKSGKRVLLERIGFIWNNLSFFGKVTGRNLFRYKRRMFMTVIGIAGCTALSLTGFGLKNSIADIVDLQYNKIFKYSGYIAVESELEPEKLDNIYAELYDFNADTVTTRALLKQYTVSGESANVQSFIAGIEDAEIFETMIDMHERVSGKQITMSSGAVLTEKLAKLLGVQAGDEITIQTADSAYAKVKVGAITEHYASHYIYMTESLYNETFGYNPEYNMIYFTNGLSDDKTVQEAFCEKMLKADGVQAVMLNSGASDSFSEMIKMMDLVIIVLIVSAGALAFVVLYNLTNVNITERIREIATLKVLGFYDREVSSYVFRENIILSVLGAGAGLLAGIALCRFIVVTAEIDEVMFGRQIHWGSYVMAFLITVAFSLIVNLIMTRVLKKISMVESLKSVE